MDNTYWQQQNSQQPLFSNVLWSRPEQRSLAGKLSIIGGNAHGFSAVSEAFGSANQAGIGSVRLVLPASLEKTVGHILPESEFAPDNKGGGFAIKALDLWLAIANWGDATILAGDLGKSSETEILLERFFANNSVPLTLVGDSIDLALISPLQLVEYKQLIVAPSFSQLQHLLTAIRYPSALTSTITLYQLVDLLHSLTQNYSFAVAYCHDDQTLIAYQGKVSTTQTTTSNLLKSAVYATVWRLQQPSKAFEAMTSGIYASLSN